MLIKNKNTIRERGIRKRGGGGGGGDHSHKESEGLGRT